jgi:hypothetical protein
MFFPIISFDKFVPSQIQMPAMKVPPRWPLRVRDPNTHLFLEPVSLPSQPLQEIRNAPNKRRHRFVEYFDLRAAQAALSALNRSELFGGKIKIEHSRASPRPFRDRSHGDSSEGADPSKRADVDGVRPDGSPDDEYPPPPPHHLMSFLSSFYL